MACATCGNSILFGGKKVGSRRYCSKKCLQADELGRISDTVPEEKIDRLVSEIRHAECPVCNKKSKLEIFKSYFVYSVIIYTSWKEKPEISCKSCARKRQLTDFISSFFVGWWGSPFELIATPIILLMNGVAMFRDPTTKPPSKELKQYVRMLIAIDMLERNNDPAQAGQEVP